MSCSLYSKVKAPQSTYRMQNSLKSKPLANVLLSWLISCPHSRGEFELLSIVSMCISSLFYYSSNVSEKDMARKRNIVGYMQSPCCTPTVCSMDVLDSLF